SDPLKSSPADPTAPARAADDLDHITIEGVVTDTAGKAVMNARVIARQTNTGNEREATTRAEGRYRFTALPPGLYGLRAEADGFQTARHDNISAVAGVTIRHDFILGVAAVEAQIAIDAGADSAAVDTSRTVVGGTVTKEQIDKLPTESRNPL